MAKRVLALEMLMVSEQAVWCAKSSSPSILMAQRRDRAPPPPTAGGRKFVSLPVPVVAVWRRGIFMPGCRKEPVLLQAVVQIINNLIFPREHKQPDSI